MDIRVVSKGDITYVCRARITGSYFSTAVYSAKPTWRRVHVSLKNFGRNAGKVACLLQMNKVSVWTGIDARAERWLSTARQVNATRAYSLYARALRITEQQAKSIYSPDASPSALLQAHAERLKQQAYLVSEWIEQGNPANPLNIRLNLDI